MGPGRTGVKGVIRDRNEALARERERFQKRLLYIKARQEKMSLAYGGKTAFEEDELRENEKAARETVDSSEENDEDGEDEKRAYRARNAKMYFDLRDVTREDGRPVFGHLREVAPSNFIKAIEEEDRTVWVLVHLYEPVSNIRPSFLQIHDIFPFPGAQHEERCQTLDTILTLLSRQNPHTKFLRARAAHFEFAVKTSRLPSGGSSCYADEYDECQGEEVEVDTELLPTLLVYRGGELEFTWVRVDLEAGPGGISTLLKR